MKHEVWVYDDPTEDMEGDLLPEYHFDYSKAKPSPYANRTMHWKATLLEKDLEAVLPRVNKDKTV